MNLSRLYSLLRTNHVLAASVVALPALLIYLWTMAPGIVFGDSPELTTAAYVMGVAHPTGYPLYMMLGWLFTHLLPFGTVAYRMNLLSVTAATIGVALFYLLALRVTRSRAASVATALLLAFSATFWSRAIIAEAYVMHTAFVIAVLLCIVSWDRKGDRRWLLAGAFVWGLSFTHHMQTMLLAPALAYFVLTSRRRLEFVHELRWTVPLFIAPLLLYLYLPLSALWHPRWTFADTATWPGFRDHVTGVMYRDFMGTKSVAELWQRVLDYAGWLIHDDTHGHHDRPAYLLSQFSASLLWVAPVGLYSLFRRNRRMFGLTLLFYMAVVSWALQYTIYNVEVYYIPSHMIVALWIGCGLRQVGLGLSRMWRKLRLPQDSRTRMGVAYVAVMLALPLLLVPANWVANDLHRVRNVEELGTALLDSLKPNAVIISSGDNWVFPVLYPHYVEGRRPDVMIVPAHWFAVPWNRKLINSTIRAAGTADPIRSAHEFSTLGSRREVLSRFIRDNRVSRPIYLVGPMAENIAVLPELRLAIPALKYVGGKEPVFEVVERAQGDVPVTVMPGPVKSEKNVRGYAL